MYIHTLPNRNFIDDFKFCATFTCFSSKFWIGTCSKLYSVCIRFSHVHPSAAVVIVNLLEGKSIQGGVYSTRVRPRMSNPIMSNPIMSNKM